MQFGRFPRKTILAATLFIAFSTANASFVEQIGAPAPSIPTMGTYAADASIKSGLKAVIPAGWQLFSHQSVTLPDNLSWEKDDTWVTVLNKFANKNDIAVLIDWDKKQIYFRSTALAMQEQEKRQMIAQAASTPLPAFKTSEPKPSVAATAPKAEAAPVEPAVAPSVAKAVTVEPLTTLPSTPHILSGTLGSESTTSLKEEKPLTTSPEVPATKGQLLPDAPLATTAVIGVNAPVLPNLGSTGQVKAMERADKPVVALPLEKGIKHSVRPPLKAKDPVLVTNLTEVAKEPSALVSQAKVPEIVSEAKLVVAESLKPVVESRVTASTSVTTPTITTTPEAVRPSNDPNELAVTGAAAFNKVSVTSVASLAAEKHGYTLSWDAPVLQFPGAVTILGADMGEDMNLVLKALGGRYSPISIAVYRESRVAVVSVATPGNATVRYPDFPFSGALKELPRDNVVPRNTHLLPPAVKSGTAVALVSAKPTPQPVIEARPVSTTDGQNVQPVSAVLPIAATLTPEPKAMESIPVVTVTPPKIEGPVKSVVTLHVAEGGQLRDALEGLLAPGWSLSWNIKDDLIATTELTATGDSLRQVLSQVLPRLGLSADMYTPSKLVVVRDADPVLDK